MDKANDSQNGKLSTSKILIISFALQKFLQFPAFQAQFIHFHHDEKRFMDLKHKNMAFLIKSSAAKPWFGYIS